ncbi:hypothetical protein DRE_01052 [Drechslerella stenobrocha 248]|uniref:Uncharacterized protein n=1 Tax=Drechslerella stenobrocha 248 TaxID=1043628 RepID=W7HYH6_9PEZI|nr:hypothetical protein DRE_01052 [Drechslerella stenobrocha 248]
MVNPTSATRSASSRRHRLVRRQTFGQRIAAFLNPLDNLLSASLLFETYDWEGLGESIAAPAGIALNVLLMIARANSNTKLGWRGTSSHVEDVLRDPRYDYSDSQAGGIFGWLMHIVAHLLFGFAVFNTVYTLNRTRQYRTFESSVHSEPPTPSARRVRVSSSPNESSPYRFVKSLFPNMPYASAPPIHDGVTEDEVWEVAKWDPTKFNLAIATYFSPLHALVVFLLLPYTPPPSHTHGHLSLDTTAHSTAYAASRMAVIWDISLINVFLTVYLFLYFKAFRTQTQDEKYISSQVFSEYNKKFVNPRVNVPTRDCGTSTDDGGSAIASPSARMPGFRTHPNPAYARHTAPEHAGGLFAGFKKSTPPASTLDHDLRSSHAQTTANAGTGTNTPLFTHDREHRASSSSASSRMSFGSATTVSSRRSFAPSDLMTPARKIAVAAGPMSAGRPSPGVGSKAPGKNGNVWGGGVDYGVQSPMKRRERRV